MNRMVLSAQLLERGAVRYTPAGLPAIDCRLCHESAVTEDGQPRRVSLEIKALAIGAMSRPLGAMALGSAGMFAGFLASARNGRGLLFHITELTPDATAYVPTSDPSPVTTPAAPAAGTASKEVHHAPAKR